MCFSIVLWCYYDINIGLQKERETKYKKGRDRAIVTFFYYISFVFVQLVLLTCILVLLCYIYKISLANDGGPAQCYLLRIAIYYYHHHHHHQTKVSISFSSLKSTTTSILMCCVHNVVWKPWIQTGFSNSSPKSN
jgi:hypothetical protein